MTRLQFGVLTTNLFSWNGFSLIRKDYRIALKQSKITANIYEDETNYNYFSLNSHVVFSTSANNSYGSDTFAGLVDLILQVGNKTYLEDPVTWEKINQHLSVIAFLIGEAGRSFNQDF